MKVVSPGATSAHMTQLVLPQHANSLAITFGGVVSDRRSKTETSINSRQAVNYWHRRSSGDK